MGRRAKLGKMPLGASPSMGNAWSTVCPHPQLELLEEPLPSQVWIFRFSFLSFFPKLLTVPWRGSSHVDLASILSMETR